MNQCDSFTVEVVGQRHEVSSRELAARTDGERTFATLSTRGEGTQDMLMQVSAAEDRLLVAATKSGPDLGDEDREELEELVNQVLAKAEGGATATGTATGTPTRTSPLPTATQTVTSTQTSTVVPTVVPTATPTLTTPPR
jgi:predicted YcjX-like family ATPase